MSLDLFGPASAAGSVSTRPGETRTFGAADTFFKDCSSPDLDDGTEFRAAWFNQVLAALRAVARGNGLTVGTQEIVPQDNADDAIVLKAIQHLMQRGQSTYAADTGAVNAVVVALSPAPPEYKGGMSVRVKMAFAPLGPSTINLNGLGAKPIVKGGAVALSGGEWSATDIVTLTYDGVNFQITNVRGPVYLVAPRTYYVNAASGSDSNDGQSSGAPFRTIQRAVTETQKFNLNGFSITINVANGGYIGPIPLPAVNGSGSVALVGNHGSPSSVTISSSTGSAVACGGVGYSMDGFAVSVSATSGGDPGSGILVQATGSMSLGAMYYGACVGSHIETSGKCSNSGPETITGGAASHVLVDTVGFYSNNTQAPPLLTIANAVTFSSAFVEAALLGVYYGTYGTITNPGNVTGSKYFAWGNGAIWTNGAGINYFPGSTAGSTNTGGQYI